MQNYAYICLVSAMATAGGTSSANGVPNFHEDPRAMARQAWLNLGGLDSLVRSVQHTLAAGHLARLESLPSTSHISMMRTWMMLCPVVHEVG
jgi:hypothetical protein